MAAARCAVLELCMTLWLPQEYILLALSQPPATEFSEDTELQGSKPAAFIQAIPKMVCPWHAATCIAG